MARIDEKVIQQLKRTVPIRELVEAHGVKLERRGNDWHGRCPFHADKTPSLVVSPKKNLWHCLGACRIGGSVIDWVMKAEGCTFVKAVERLKAFDAETAPARAHEPPPAEPARELPRTAEEQALLDRVIEHYHQTLKDSPEALEYLERRGLVAPGLIDRFKLGYSNRSLLRILPSKDTPEGVETHARLAKLGLVHHGGHEHFAGSLVFPIFDADGHVAQVYGRRRVPPPRNTSPHRYLPGPHRTVFHAEAFEIGPEIVLCEAIIDALTFWCAGIEAVTTSYGVEGFTAEHLRLMKKHGTQRVLLAYDRDPAGDRAAAALAEKLKAEGIASYRVEWPKGMDANDYARKLRPASKSLPIVLARALPMLDAPARAQAEAQALDLDAGDDEDDEPAEAPAPELELAETPNPPSSSSLAAPVSGPPASPTSTIPTEVREGELVMVLGDRRYRIRGLDKNLSPETMKLNVLVGRGEAYFVDHLDLYSARQRLVFVKQASADLGVDEDVVKRDLGQILLDLELRQADRIADAMKPKTLVPVMTPEEQAAALDLLQDPKILDRILADFEAAGVVGEETNKLVAYLGAVSRKLDDPLAVIIQSSSAAGKSSLMEAVLAFMPDEERIKYSAMTGQSLFYMGESNLKHKVLAIVEEEGAERAAYALKLLQSEKELTIASTGKDPTTGRLITQEYRVEGPVMIFLTTTAIEVDEELLNRCLVLTVDEDRAQTQAIHRLQRKRETLEGILLRHQQTRLRKLHQNAQRMLRSIKVANPFAETLTFLDHKTRTRRDHMKYLVLIRAIALLHQHQRPLKTAKIGEEIIEYIEVTESDLELANRLAREVLGRTLSELPPQTTRLLSLIEVFVKERADSQRVLAKEVRFTRRDVRDATGWGHTQLKVHMRRLEELELLVVRHQKGQRFEYELAIDVRREDGRVTPGLIDLEAVRSRSSTSPDRAGSKADRAGQNGHRAAPGRPLVGGVSGAGRSGENDSSPAALAPFQAFKTETTLLGAVRGRGANKDGTNGHARVRRA